MQVFFARYYVPIYRFALPIVRDVTMAEDLISDVFLNVWRQAAQFEARATVSTELLAVTKYKALNAEAAHRGPNWIANRLRASRTRRIIWKSRTRRNTATKFFASALPPYRRNMGKSSTSAITTGKRSRK